MNAKLFVAFIALLMVVSIARADGIGSLDSEPLDLQAAPVAAVQAEASAYTGSDYSDYSSDSLSAAPAYSQAYSTGYPSYSYYPYSYYSGYYPNYYQNYYQRMYYSALYAPFYSGSVVYYYNPSSLRSNSYYPYAYSNNYQSYYPTTTYAGYATTGNSVSTYATASYSDPPVYDPPAVPTEPSPKLDWYKY